MGSVIQVTEFTRLCELTGGLLPPLFSFVVPWRPLRWRRFLATVGLSRRTPSCRTGFWSASTWAAVNTGWPSLDPTERSSKSSVFLIMPAVLAPSFRSLSASPPRSRFRLCVLRDVVQLLTNSCRRSCTDPLPRVARLDLHGLLQHAMKRGIEKRDNFLDDADREYFAQE